MESIIIVIISCYNSTSKNKIFPKLILYFIKIRQNQLLQIKRILRLYYKMTDNNAFAHTSILDKKFSFKK